MSGPPLTRADWRLVLVQAQAVGGEALDPDAVLTGVDGSTMALRFRHALRGGALGPFPVAGATVEAARLAFVMIGKAVLDAGLPAQRARFGRMLTTLSVELDGILDDDAARQTAEQLRRAGAGD